VSSWEVNCAANNETNGVDLRTQGSALRKRDVVIGPTGRRLAKANIIDLSHNNAVGLPDPFLPKLPSVNGSTGVIKSFILPSNKTGVVCSRSTSHIYCPFAHSAKLEDVRGLIRG
jgi:hypothetical protein